MRSFKQIKADYRFTAEHEERLREMAPVMKEHAEEIMGTLSLWIMGTRDTAEFFTDESRRRHVFDAQKKWFLDLFSGRYDNRYHDGLIRIGAVHVKNGVDAHFMNRAVNIVRNASIDVLSRFVESKEELADKAVALGKMLDINLDVITLSYIEEEIKIYSPVYKVKSALIGFAERFSQTMNLALVLALIGLTLGVLALFVYDLREIVTGQAGLGRGIISALGSMLILWVMIELMNTEISHLKGGGLYISVFIGVALITVIREMMIATLQHETPEKLYTLIAAILVMGVVYWLVKKAEEKVR
jgi:uncharacterized membrane protein (DUF373 family)